MATNKATIEREVRPACAFLWIADPDAKHPAAPPWAGGQRFEEQERVVTERAERDGIVLGDADLVLTIGTKLKTANARLPRIMAALQRRPVERAYIPAAFYENTTSDEMWLTNAAFKGAGVELVLCD